eukprot:717583-Pelagomonas_calceolata.AAC.4
MCLAAIIAFLIVESVVVLTLLHLYQLHLTVFVERARLGGMLAMVGLPIPVLKLMHKKPLMVRVVSYGSWLGLLMHKHLLIAVTSQLGLAYPRGAARGRKV